MSNSELFLEKYKELEKAVRSTYNLREQDSISYYLRERSEYKQYAEDIAYCQKVRNFLCHETKLDGDFAIEASDGMIKFIDKLILDIESQPKCSDIQICLCDVYWRFLTDSVKETMAVMRERGFTHVPILDDNGAVIGVFDENSVFTYIADEKIVSIDDGLKFSDIQKHLSIEGREMEEFIFVKADSYVVELERLVENAFLKGRRIELAFVTASGSPKEKLQGIITPFDIIKL